MAKENRKLAAILSADVVGYSRLMHDNEAATVTTLKEYRAAISRIIDQHSGRVVNAPGDNILAEFPSAVEGVQAAVEIQKNIEGRNAELQESRRMMFRIGVNLGDVLEEEDGTIYGDGVNIAARMEALADDDGGICISSSVHDAVEGKIEFGFDFLGAQQVKNIAKPINVYRVRSHPAEGTIAPQNKAGRSSMRIALLVGMGIAALIITAVLAWLLTHETAVEPIVTKATVNEEASEPKVALVAEKPSIAVLPFTNFGGDPEQDYFADGITEEIITTLTRFPDLKVLPRNTSFQYKDQTIDVKELGQELEVKYVLEGSIRKAADIVRVTVQLLSTEDGAHLWTETYERNLSVADIFAIQDEIAEGVTGMIAGSYGIISLTDYEQVKRKGTDDLEAYDCVLRLYVYRRTMGEKKHGEIRDCLERAVKEDPEYSDAWAWLAFMYSQELAAGYNPLPAPLERSIKAARRAVEIDPMSGIAHVALARAYFYLGDLDLFFPEAEKSVALNPNNSDVIATMGYYLGYAGEHERGLELMRKAMSMSVSYPGWLHESIFWIYFGQGEYDLALNEARSLSNVMPEWRVGYALMAAAYGQLGRVNDAQTAVIKLLEPEADATEYTPETWLNFHIAQEVIDRYRTGLHNVGFDFPSDPVSVSPAD